MYLFRYFMVMLSLSIAFNTAAMSTQQQITLVHADFPEPLKFNVTLPAGYDKNKSKSYVMMFDFHPNSDTYLRGMHDWMSHNGEWPWLKTIIVSPVNGNRVGKLFDSTGKTTPLLDFFEQQLIPEIEKRYRTNGFKIMSGFRVNGTIVLSTLINKPNMFNAYIATSPELTNDLAGILSSAGKKLAKINDKPRFLLFTHGSSIKEDHQQDLYGQLYSVLKSNAPENLDWHYRDFGGHYFMSLPPLSAITGIEKIFDDIHTGLSPTSEISQQGIQAIIQHYDFLSKQKYGFKVSPKKSIKSLGSFLLNTSPQAGLNILKEIKLLYPDDAYSYHHLAQAYAQLGDYDNAVKFQKDAVKIADNMLTWHKKRHRIFLQEYLSKSSMSPE